MPHESFLLFFFLAVGTCLEMQTMDDSIPETNQFLNILSHIVDRLDATSTAGKPPITKHLTGYGNHSPVWGNNRAFMGSCGSSVFLKFL